VSGRPQWALTALPVYPEKEKGVPELCLLKIPSEPEFERLRELLSNRFDEANRAAKSECQTLIENQESSDAEIVSRRPYRPRRSHW